jgi:hypothetical protein
MVQGEHGDTHGKNDINNGILVNSHPRRRPLIS